MTVASPIMASSVAAPNGAAARGPERLVRFGPLAAPIRFRRCDDLLDAARSILRGWDPDARPSPAAGGARPVIRVARARRGYRRVSPWTRRPSEIREKTRRTLVSALCGLHFEIVDAYVADRPRQVMLHAAGVVLLAGLVLFPALAKAGKSVLTVELAARGGRVFADDVVPVDLVSRRASAIGIVPRLRPPLPANASPRFLEFVASHRGHGYGDRLYVSIPEAQMAPHGESEPVRGIVLLERASAGSARLTPVDPGEALEALLLQNFAAAPRAAEALAALHSIAMAATCLRLRYARSDDAASALYEAFGRAPSADAAREAPR